VVTCPKFSGPRGIVSAYQLWNGGLETWQAAPNTASAGGPAKTDEPRTAVPKCECGCADIDASRIVGWCLHCDHVYANYTPALENRHFANHCPDVPETVREAARARLAKRRM